MKRLGLALAGLALAGAVSTAHAQLTMQMGNGWNFTFAGNVNAFLTYESESEDGELPPGVLYPIGVGSDRTRVQTGLLPAFAVFDAKGKEGNFDLGVHFGFAPEVQCANGVHDCFGAQIDMRQVYLTVGGTWGQILAGRELGLFARQNILTDQTLFGTGVSGNALGGSGTTLGRIGFGYPYPNFKAQMTYSTAAGKPGQLSIGLFEAASNGVYDQTQIPRLEAEFNYSKGAIQAWLGGLVQTNKSTATDESATSYGASGGLKWSGSKFSLVGSGYYGSGIGTTLMFFPGDPLLGGSSLGVDAAGDLRNSYGYILQASVVAGAKTTIAASYGASILQTTEAEGGGSTQTFANNSAIVGGIYHQWTKSLKWVLEGTYGISDIDEDTGLEKNSSFLISTGLMLFF